MDALRARREWLAVAEHIERLGGVVAVLPPVEGLSGLTFAAEAGHPLPARSSGGAPRFILPRMKPAHRQGEAAAWRPMLSRLGFELIELPHGIWEGQGDVASFDGASLLFWGGRTDELGLHAAKAHFSGEVLELNVWEPAFHGNMAVLPLPNSTCIVCADVLHEDSLALLEARVGRDCMHFVSEEEILAYSTNGLVVGDTIICPTTLPPRVRGLIEREGMKVVDTPMNELCEKGGGASRCLVCRFDDAPSIEIPDEFRLARFAEEISREA
ncbi:MAG: hypothetical protein U0271_34500 [Polyangiaceae bacterium]